MLQEKCSVSRLTLPAAANFDAPRVPVHVECVLKPEAAISREDIHDKNGALAVAFRHLGSANGNQPEGKEGCDCCLYHCFLALGFALGIVADGFAPITGWGGHTAARTAKIKP